MNKLLFAVILVPCTVFGGTFKLRSETNSRFLYHTVTPLDIASFRNSIQLEATFKDGPFWTFHAGGKGYTEGAFASNESRYGADIRRRESQEIELRDAYIQYKSGGWTVRGGNQQIVWGEAFGFYYADIVNPKDLRELGIGPLDENRVSIPMLSTKYVFDKYSLQAFFVPMPFFNKMPADGGDFSFPFGQFFPGATYTHYEERSKIISSENFEGGIRASGQLGKWDLSLLFASYLDRSPSYSSSFTSATNVNISDSHDRLKTFGATSSVPCGPFICRAEVLWHLNKSFNTFQAPNFVPAKSDEYVGVLGVDYTESDRTHLGLQFSENLRAQEFPGALGVKSQQNLSIHVKVATFLNHRAETIVSYLPHDQSILWQMQYLIPVTERIELLLTGDTFFGNASSQFGRYKQASRAGTILKIYLVE